MPDRPGPHERFVDAAHESLARACSRTRAWTLAIVLALAVVSVLAGDALRGAGSAFARVYDPATTPKARYVPPLSPWPQPSYRAKDFAIIKKNGIYHLFYTRVQRFVPHHYKSGNLEILNETTFGHAISADLENWTEFDSVLHTRSNQFDAHHLWAPTVVERLGVTYMFYTGVRDTQMSASPIDWLSRRQVIGTALSVDPALRTWFQGPNPVWAPCAGGGLPGVSWALCTPTVPRGTADFRDPFMLAPASGQGSEPWRLYYTARVRADQHNYVAGVAEASTPTSPFSDAGALWDTYFPPINSKVESPHAFRTGNNLHLFFSGDDNSTGIAWFTSQGTPLGPWQSHGSIADFLESELDHPYSFPLDPWAWFASEHFAEDFPSGHADYFCVVHSYDAPPSHNPPPPQPVEDISIIEFRQMLWQPNGLFRLVSPNPVRTLNWSPAGTRAGTLVELRIAVEGAADRVADLQYSLTVDGVETIVPASAIGMPASKTLTDGVIVLPWLARNPYYDRAVEWTARIVGQPLHALATITVLPGEGGSADLIDEGDPLQKGFIGRNQVPGGSGGKSNGSAGVTLTIAAVEGGRASGGAGVDLALVVPDATDVRFEVFDVTGRRVRDLGARRVSAGRTVERWDGRDEASRRVPRGLYFVRAITPLGRVTTKLLVLD